MSLTLSLKIIAVTTEGTGKYGYGRVFQRIKDYVSWKLLADMLIGVSDPLHFRCFSLGEQHICNQ